MDLNINLKEGKFTSNAPAPATEETAKTPSTAPVAHLESPGSFVHGISGFELAGVPLGAGALAGTWADLISALVAKLPGGLATGTMGILVSAWGSAWAGKKVKFIGAQTGRDAALVLVANAARPYTAPIVTSIVGMIPNFSGAIPGQPSSLAQANEVAGDYYARTRRSR